MIENNPTPTNTEDRKSWYDKAEEWEREFVEKFGGKFQIIINPAKFINKYAPDLYCMNSFICADLKVQNVPFFTSQKQYGIDPNYCWTFNHADFIDYSFSHDDRFGLFVWVIHEQQESFGVKIFDQESIYFTTLGKLKDYLKANGHIHKYIRRLNDTKGNAYGSFGIDVRNKIFIKL